jgi:TonB-dependent starch-binding outer membrane protein SusC
MLPSQEVEMPSPLRWLGAVPLLGAAILVCVAVPRAVAQGTGTIRGRVTDANTQRPVDGVQVYVAGTELGTLTGADGRYQFSVRAGEIQLRTRRVGFASSTTRVVVTAGQVTDADLEVRAAAVALDVVVVTGAGAETEKRKLGNTVATIDASQLRNAPVANVSEQLAARDPAVAVLPSGGLAGEGAQIRIRTAASLTQANEPVVYVDGVRVDRGGGFGDNIGAGGGGTPSRLDDINPESVDHIEILKGAAAATLYGTEASAGVIQVFTKKGSRGAPRWDFMSEQAISNYPLSRYAPEAGFARDTASARRLGMFFWNDSTRLQPFQVFERNFVQDLFKTGYAGTYSASVSGGTPGVTYYVNGRYFGENGPFGAAQLGPAASRDRKAQGTASLDLLPTDRVKIHVTSEYVDAHNETPNNNNNIYAPLTNAIFSHPERASCVTPRASSTPTGDGHCTGPGNPTGVGSFGTVREDMQRTVTQDAKHFIGGLHATYQAFPSLSLEGTLGVDVTSQLSQALRPFGNDVDGFINVSPAGQKTVDNRTQRIITAEAKGTWKRQLGEEWSSVLVAGGQGFITRLEDEGSAGEAFPAPGLEVTSAGANQNAFERFLATVNAGLLAQEQIGYRDYAFVTVGGRYDRNSAFGRTSQGVFYPKVSVSVQPSLRPAWQSSSLTSRLSTFRLRAALGKSGLQPGAFDKLTTFAPLASELGPGVAPYNLGNPDLKPEVSTEWELGTEVGALQDRAALDITYWRRVTHDALYPRQYAPSGGFINLQLSNIGEIRSGGYDIAASFLPVAGANLSVKLFANASWMWSFVTKLGGAPPLKVGGSYPRYRNFVKEGYPVGALFGAKLPGPCSARPAGATYLCLNPGENPFDLTGPAGTPDGNPDTDAELLAYLAVPRPLSSLNPLRVDESGTGNYLANYLGKSTPDWQGAFGLNATLLRNVELGTVFEYKFGNYTITNLTDAFRKSNPVIGRNLRRAAEVEATMLNPASTPDQRLAAARTWANELKALSPYDGLNQGENGKFLRFRELSLTYNVPSQWVEQALGVRYLSVTVAGRNLALWTPYSGIDPETNEYGRGGANADLNGIDQNFGQAIDAFGFALPRRFTVTVRMGF